MKKYILLNFCSCLLVLGIISPSQAQNVCPTSFDKEKLRTFDLAVVDATLSSNDPNRRRFVYQDKKWYISLKDWDQFKESNISKKARTMLKEIKFLREEKLKTMGTRCYYEQTRTLSLDPNRVFKLQFKIDYLKQ